VPRAGARRVPKILEELPDVKLDHLRVMTDGTGILQHAKFGTPDRDHGYCTDDNARALIVASMYRALRADSSLERLVQVYLGFVLSAYDRRSRRFRNFMSYDRRWMEETGSEDSHGRALWGLGSAVKYASKGVVRDISTRLFSEALTVVEDFGSPRAWAFTMIGLQAYLEVYGGDAEARRLRVVLAERLRERFDAEASEEWYWFEDTVTYANAKIPHALIMAGQWIPDGRCFEHGLASLQWLLERQTADNGDLSIVGNNGWMPRGGGRAKFDQQPIEAMALVEACVEAYRSTGGEDWLRQAQRCLEWFLGRNELSVPLYDFASGGCSDGLNPNGASANQGAESTLAWLISLLSLMEVLG
jgi:hypothetical protein